MRAKATKLQTFGANYNDKKVVYAGKNHYFGKATIEHHGIGLKEADVARKLTRICSPRLPKITS